MIFIIFFIDQQIHLQAEKLKIKLPFSENKSPFKPGLLDNGLPFQCTRLNPAEFPKPHDGKSYFTASYQKSLHYRFKLVEIQIVLVDLEFS